MINFVVCEDNKIILQKNMDIINKTMFKNNSDYRIYPFTEDNNALQEIIKKNLENKIYILDIELENVSGIDIAREIRKNDKESIIIISTTYVEYLPHTIKSKLLLFDFISKFDNYEESLSNAINKAISQYNEED